jgi:hypothetical protein
MGYMRYGLKPTPDDPRDYKLGALYTLPKLSELPERFVLPYRVKHQGDSDFCSAYTSCAMSETQEGVELEPSWSFAISKVLSDDAEEWGQDIRTALKAHVKFGSLAVKDVPPSMEYKTPTIRRYIRNWPPLQEKALPHKKQTFFKVSGPYDHYDNIRAAIYKFKTAVGTGVEFGWPLDQVILDNMAGGQGHAMAVVGFEPRGLIYLNSFGEQAGDNGVHYVTRDVVNWYVNKYGAYMFTDISREEAEYYLQNGIRMKDNWLVQLIKAFVKLITFDYGSTSRKHN